MADEARTRVGIRIFSPDLNPDDVNRVIPLTPDHAHRKGDPRSNPKYSPYRNGVWILESEAAPEEPLEAHLEDLLLRLEPYQAEILRFSESHQVDFYCGLFDQPGFELPASLLRRIGNLGAALGVSVYSPIEGEPKDLYE